MIFLPRIIFLLLISILIACKKSSDPAPVDNRIPLMELSVYDSQLWSMQNRFPPVADAEIEVMRIPKKFQHGTSGPEEPSYSYTIEYIQSSLKSVFKGRTNNEGKLIVMLADTTDLKKYRWFAKASKGGRSIFSPDGIMCAGVFEDAESVKNGAHRWNETNSIGGRKPYDWNGDGVIGAADKGIGLPLGMGDPEAKMWIY